MRVTSKGQVTIPLAIRQLLGIEPGSEVEFTVDGDRVQLVRRAPGRGAELVAAMRGHGREHVSMSTDEIMALTRGED